MLHKSFAVEFIVAAVMANALQAAVAGPLVVDLTVGGTTMQDIISAQVCSGLLNRDSSDKAGVYTLLNQPYDSDWLVDTTGISNPFITPTDQFISSCFQLKNSVQGYILYDYAAQQAVVPNIITLAAVLNAIPLEASSPDVADNVLVFDAVKEWAGFSALDVNNYMFNHYINDTTTLAWMNPGYF
jgi:hypothetical protein